MPDRRAFCRVPIGRSSAYSPDTWACSVRAPLPAQHFVRLRSRSFGRDMGSVLSHWRAWTEGGPQMKKLLSGCVIAAAALSLGVGSVSAAEPVVQGCVGESVSANAMAPGSYGGFISSISKHGGIAGDVHLAQA